MVSTAQQGKVRINIQLPAEIKDRLFQASSRQGKNVSALVRESIEEKLMQLDKQALEEQMKVAYQELAEENIRICEDFKFSDAENLPIVNLSQIRTLDKSRLTGSKLATLPDELMEKVDLALKNSLAL